MAEPEIDNALVLGYYHPFYLYILVKYGMPDFTKRPDEVTKHLSRDQKLAYALARYTFFHEIRHFHDYFGTMAGISLFYVHLRQLRAFARFIEKLRAADQKLHLPLDSSWVDGDPNGETAKGLVRNWRMLVKATAAFSQAFQKTTGNVHHPNEYVVYKKREGDNPDVPTFPLQSRIGYPGKLRDLTIYYPIGLEVLAEGNTQALQRGLMEVEFPDGLADHLVGTGQPRRLDPGDPVESARSSALPYNVTDFLVSKYLRLRGHPTFKRKTILQLTDQALSGAYIEPVSKPWEVPATFKIVDVGRMFIDMLEDTNVSDLVNGTVPYPQHITDFYQEYLNGLMKGKKPEEIAYEADFVSPIDMIESVVTHHVIVPLIAARLETKHEVFYSIEKYLEMLPKLPFPPVIFVGESDYSEHYAHYMRNQNIGDAWMKYCMLMSAMHDICDLRSGINCFRAQELKNSKLNLCNKGTCRGNITVGNCDEWTPSKSLPDCVFASMLRRFGLASKLAAG